MVAHLINLHQLFLTATDQKPFCSAWEGLGAAHGLAITRLRKVLPVAFQSGEQRILQPVHQLSRDPQSPSAHFSFAATQEELAAHELVAQWFTS